MSVAIDDAFDDSAKAGAESRIPETRVVSGAGEATTRTVEVNVATWAQCRCKRDRRPLPFAV